MDDDHFSKIAKINNFFNLIILGETKTCNSTKIGHILCTKNKIVKDLMNAF
jgi:hypothetical protein